MASPEFREEVDSDLTNRDYAGDPREKNCNADKSGRHVFLVHRLPQLSVYKLADFRDGFDMVENGHCLVA